MKAKVLEAYRGKVSGPVLSYSVYAPFEGGSANYPAPSDGRKFIVFLHSTPYGLRAVYDVGNAHREVACEDPSSLAEALIGWRCIQDLGVLREPDFSVRATFLENRFGVGPVYMVMRKAWEGSPDSYRALATDYLGNWGVCMGTSRELKKLSAPVLADLVKQDKRIVDWWINHLEQQPAGFERENFKACHPLAEVRERAKLMGKQPQCLPCAH